MTGPLALVLVSFATVAPEAVLAARAIDEPALVHATLDGERAVRGAADGKRVPGRALATAGEIVRVADGDDGEEASWSAPLDYYFSWSLDDDLDPDAESVFVLIWVLSVFGPAGALWSPYLFEEPGDGLLADLMISAIVHYAIGALPAVLFVIPIIGWIAGYILVVGMSLANYYYFVPVATINLYSRSLKRKKAGLAHPLDLERRPLPSSKGDDDRSAAAGRARAHEVAYAY